MYGMCEQELALSILYIMQRIIKSDSRNRNPKDHSYLGAALVDKYYMYLHASNACI